MTSAKETEEKWAGTPGGGADEAEQVNQFLEKERQVFENTMENASNREEPNSPPSVEVCMKYYYFPLGGQGYSGAVVG